MSCPDRDPYQREHGNDDLVCSQCEQFPAEVGGLCERCRLFKAYRDARPPLLPAWTRLYPDENR